MIELKVGLATNSLLRQLPELRQSVADSGTAMTWQDGQSYYRQAVERLEGVFSHSLLDATWHERLYSNGYWAVREMSEGTSRPFPLLQAQAGLFMKLLDQGPRGAAGGVSTG